MDYQSWLDYVGVERPATKGRARSSGVRSPYAGASGDRLVQDRLEAIGILSPNAEIRMGLRALRQRARDLRRNNEFVKAYVRMMRNNVAGPYGFKFQSKIQKARGGNDDVANALIERAYKKFSQRGQFTVCGTLTRAQFERACIADVAVDGEVLIELVYGSGINDFGFAVRRLDGDLLDEELNIAFGGSGPDGMYLGLDREIRMGVERDRWGRHTAYWLLQTARGDDLTGYGRTPRHRRVPADKILFRFLADEERPGAVRGISPLAVAIRRMQILGGYEESALVAARTGAAKMGFYKPPEDATGPADGSAVADGQQGATGQEDLLQEFEPGTMGVLPPGWDVADFDPTYPNDKFGDFRKAMLRAFCAGIGVNYNAIGKDLEGVNLSSIRYGVQDDQDVFDSIQHWFITEIAESIFARWLQHSIDFGLIGRIQPGPGVFERLHAPEFRGRGWKYMDPIKDLEADAKAIELGQKSYSSAAAERGEDFEENLQQLQKDREMAAKYGVPLGAPKPAAPAAPSAPADDDGDEGDKGEELENDDE